MKTIDFMRIIIPSSCIVLRGVSYARFGWMSSYIHGRGLIATIAALIHVVGTAPVVSGQNLSFGVVTGATLTDDFRSVSTFTPSIPGILCGDQPCPAYTVTTSDVSRLFILGPSLELGLSDTLSLHVEALYRPTRTIRTSESFPASRQTHYSWEFPVLAKYRFPAFGADSFVEIGPSFRPSENNEQYGIAAGTGVEIPVGGVRLAPGVRYLRWIDNGRKPETRPHQLALLVGVRRASGATRISALGADITLGVVAGIGLTNGFPTTDLRRSIKMKSPIVGVMLEYDVSEHLSVEVNGLYRPLRLIGQGGGRTTVLTWEFPLLLKYRLPTGGVKPFLTLGPSFRASGNLNGADPTTYGFTSGAGVEAGLGKMKIAPGLRYTRWAEGPRSTKPDQVELLIGFSF